MIFHIKSAFNTGATVISLRCPGCGQIGSFAGLQSVGDVVSNDNRFGHRCCPNPKCLAHLFVVLDNTNPSRIVISYPALRLDFDASDIPGRVVAALEEAITCHAHKCFTAAAIMVRRTLEELCDDQGTQGNNLKARLDDLSGKVQLPPELINGLHELRLLGNDAAHIELKSFAEISQEAVTLAIDVTKEVLKRVYQTGTLIDRLSAYRK